MMRHIRTVSSSENNSKEQGEFDPDRMSISSHDNKEFRNRSIEKQRGMAFGFRKTATTAKIPG
jgi:hypothetical protein